MTNNKNWFDGLTENQIRNRILLGLVILSISIFAFRKDIVKNFNWFEQNKEWQEQEYKEEYFGIVFKKGRDNRNNTFIQLKDSNKIFLNEEKMWNKILIGDSVYKQKNSKILNVIREDKIIKIDYDDAYRYRDSLIRAGKY